MSEQGSEIVGPSPRLILVGSEPAVAKAVAFLAEVDVPPGRGRTAGVIAELSPALAAALEAGMTSRAGFRLGASSGLAADLVRPRRGSRPIRAPDCWRGPGSGLSMAVPPGC